MSDSVRFSIRQYVLASALLTAWYLLGGSGAWADYVSASYLSRGSEFPSLASFPVWGSWQHTAESGAAPSGAPTEDHSRDQPNRHVPSCLLQVAKLFQTAWHSGVDGGASGSTGSSTVSGPSGQQLATWSRLELPHNDAVSLLPPEEEITHPFSITSRLFRPPRPSI